MGRTLNRYNAWPAIKKRAKGGRFLAKVAVGSRLGQQSALRLTRSIQAAGHPRDSGMVFALLAFVLRRREAVLRAKFSAFVLRFI
jgi:hypothetical protein